MILMVGQKSFVNGVIYVKFGEMKHEINPMKGEGQNIFGFWSKSIYYNEGRSLFKKYPEYEYLKNDPWVTDEEHFYETVLYAYMAEYILKNNPEFQNNYDNCKKNATDLTKNYKNSDEGSYLYTNLWFVQWYQSYLRERADPGVLERERREKFEKQRELKMNQTIQKIHEQAQLEKDVAAGRRVECPYCHSMNTEKISGVARGVSIYALGVASPKLGKQWHCNNCKSDF